MEIDAVRFRDLAEVIGADAKITAYEACAAVQIAYFAADLAGRLNWPSRRALETLSREVCSVIGCPPPSEAILTHEHLDERDELHKIGVLARDLQSASARELAFAIAYLSTLADLGAKEIESQVIVRLRRTLDI